MLKQNPTVPTATTATPSDGASGSTPVIGTRREGGASRAAPDRGARVRCAAAVGASMESFATA